MRSAVFGAVALATLAACAREDEAALRARLAGWFALGETVAFVARSDCAAAVVRVIDGQIASAMPVTRDVPRFLRALSRRGAAALDDAAQAPDAGLMATANSERATGMAMRRAALEARGCMDRAVEGAFRRALLDPQAVLAYDRDSGAVMLLDREAGQVIVAMGAG